MPPLSCPIFSLPTLQAVSLMEYFRIFWSERVFMDRPSSLCHVKPVMSNRFAPANISSSCLKTQRTYESPSPYRQAVPSLPRACSPRKKKSIAPHSVPHSPQPPRCAKGASLFVPESSRAFLSCPRTMHDEIRTGPPYGHALSIPHCREAQTKTTLSFQNLEAALRLVYRQAADPVVREVL